MNLSPEGWLKDKRGNWSFSRIAPAICLLAVFVIWWSGTHWKDLQDYATKAIDKLLEFAKWAFLAGKGSEEIGVALTKPENSTRSSTETIITKPSENP